MDTFTITTLLTKKEYTNFLVNEIYRKPYTIIVTFVGLVAFIASLLQLFKVVNLYLDPPLLILIFAMVIIVSPLVNVIVTRRTSYSNPSISNEIRYTFRDDGIIVNGLTFDSTLKWMHIIKLKETEKYLLLFSNRKQGNFIDKSNLTLGQIQFIKSKVREK